jgi:hypothetical protein
MNFQTSEGDKTENLESEIRALQTDAKRAQVIGTGAALVGLSSALVFGAASLPIIATTVATLSGLASGVSLFRKIRDENALKEKQSAFSGISGVAPQAARSK